MINEYFATVTNHQREEQFKRDLEHRRGLAERRSSELPRKRTRRSVRVTLGALIGRGHTSHSHQPARG